MLVALLPADAEARRYASIVIDAGTGEVLHARHPHRKAFPASLTKMMTLYMTFEALQSGRLKPNQKLKVSKRAAKMPPSKLRLKAGQAIAVEDAILALVTKSANDVAVVIAEALGGSEVKFAKMMTKKARELGMSRTVFRNASGLPNSKQLSTASDMATLALALLRHFPAQYAYFSTRKFTYGGRKYNNHNKLLKNFKGTDGIKTGYTHASGYNLVASAVRGNRRLIGVVFGGRTGGSRDRHMRKLLSKGFAKVAKTRVPPLSHPPRRKPISIQTLVPIASSTSAPRGNQKAALPSVKSDVPESSAGGARAAPAPRQKPALTTTPPAPAAKPMRLETLLEQGSRSGIESKAPGAAGFKAVTGPRLPIASPARHWGIQVGAYRQFTAAHLAAHEATRKAPQYLHSSQVTIRPVKGVQGSVFRARLLGMTEQNAHLACDTLKQQQISCHVVPPNRS